MRCSGLLTVTLLHIIGVKIRRGQKVIVVVLQQAAGTDAPLAVEPDRLPRGILYRTKAEASIDKTRGSA